MFYTVLLSITGSYSVFLIHICEGFWFNIVMLYIVYLFLYFLMLYFNFSTEHPLVIKHATLTWNGEVERPALRRYDGLYIF